MPVTTPAGEWIRDNGEKWNLPKSRKQISPKEKVGAQVRAARMGRKKHPQPIKAFVENHRNAKHHDCIFVPGAQEHVAAHVVFCGKSISAARYMALLTLGAPKHEDVLVRHICGNGHLSCINPDHLAWGDHGQNMSDAATHRAVGDNVQDRLHAI